MRPISKLHFPFCVFDRADLIVVMFDAHKLDISDELKMVIDTLKPHHDKMRCGPTIDTYCATLCESNGYFVSLLGGGGHTAQNERCVGVGTRYGFTNKAIAPCMRVGSTVGSVARLRVWYRCYRAVRRGSR